MLRMSPTSPRSAARPADLSCLSILVVDDEPAVTRLVKLMLSDLGVTQVFTAKDGREALTFLGNFEEEVHVVICDWNMPRMSGIDLLKQVRTVHPDMAFLMLTGRADMASVKEARDYGVSAYLLKPFSNDQLSEKLTILAGRRAAAPPRQAGPEAAAPIDAAAEREG